MVVSIMFHSFSFFIAIFSKNPYQNLVWLDITSLIFKGRDIAESLLTPELLISKCILPVRLKKLFIFFNSIIFADTVEMLSLFHYKFGSNHLPKIGDFSSPTPPYLTATAQFVSALFCKDFCIFLFYKRVLEINTFENVVLLSMGVAHRLFEVLFSVCLVFYIKLTLI